MEDAAENQRTFSAETLMSRDSSAPNPFRTKLRRLAMRLIAATLGLVVALGFCEVILHALGISFPLPYQTDPHCGTKLQPHFSGLFTKEGRGKVTTTGDGRRDREYAFTKEPNTFRIAILGDSYAEALQVQLEETFWSVLQVELQACGPLAGKKLEVLNFGVSGFGTAQELQMLEHYVWDYQPDLVLVAFLTGNDISDNSASLSTNPVRPFYYLAENQLRLDNSFQQHPTYIAASSPWGKLKTRMINSFRSLQLLREISAQLRNRSAAASQTHPTELGLDPIYESPQTTTWSDAWNVTEKILQTMHLRSREKGSQFCVVTLTNAIQVEPDPKIRVKLQQSLGVENLFYPDFRVVDIGKRHGFRVFTLAPKMQAEAEKNQRYFHGFPNTKLGTGHWNQEGHRRAGQIMATEICQWLSQAQGTNVSPKP